MLKAWLKFRRHMLILIIRPLSLVQHWLLSKSKIQNLNFPHGFVFISSSHVYQFDSLCSHTRQSLLTAIVNNLRTMTTPCQMIYSLQMVLNLMTVVLCLPPFTFAHGPQFLMQPPLRASTTWLRRGRRRSRERSEFRERQILLQPSTQFDRTLRSNIERHQAVNTPAPVVPARVRLLVRRGKHSSITSSVKTGLDQSQVRALIAHI